MYKVIFFPGIIFTKWVYCNKELTLTKTVSPRVLPTHHVDPQDDVLHAELPAGYDRCLRLDIMMSQVPEVARGVRPVVTLPPPPHYIIHHITVTNICKTKKCLLNVNSNFLWVVLPGPGEGWTTCPLKLFHVAGGTQYGGESADHIHRPTHNTVPALLFLMWILWMHQILQMS